jgi:hypothetical protein
MCFGFGTVMLLIHALGVITMDGSFLFAAILMFAFGLLLLACSSLIKWKRNANLDEDIARFHDELDDFLKSNGSAK